MSTQLIAVRNRILSPGTAAKIDHRVARVLFDLGNPPPPLDLKLATELLKLDLEFYSRGDESLLRTVVHRIKVAGKQVLQRPSYLVDLVGKLNLKAVCLVDQKRILIDQDLPAAKIKWAEAHEIGHSLLPWHADVCFGDTKFTLTPECHEALENEANFAAQRLIFLRDTFTEMARSLPLTMDSVRSLSKLFGNSLTSTLCAFAMAQARPSFAMVSSHPVPENESDVVECRYLILSKLFDERFGHVSENVLIEHIKSYCQRRRWKLGEDEVVFSDKEGGSHCFRMETIFNSHEALTLGCKI